MKKYLVIDESDACYTQTGLHEGEDSMLESVQNKEIGHISVYEVVKKVRLIQQPSIVLDDDV